jgi:hypothetical protein
MITKRLIISTILGIMFGIVCYLFAKSGGGFISKALALSIISGRTLIGFGIGISNFNAKHWVLHGLLMGLVFSIPAGFGAMLGSGSPDFSPKMMFVVTVAMGMVYGLLIELITTVVFKAKQ